MAGPGRWRTFGGTAARPGGRPPAAALITKRAAAGRGAIITKRAAAGRGAIITKRAAAGRGAIITKSCI